MAAVLVAAVGLASLSAMSSAATRVHGKGQLVSRVLAYVYPGTKQVPYWGYIVYFRTAGGFPGRSADGSYLVPGSFRIGDSPEDDGSDGSFVALGAGKPHGRCYRWSVTTDRKASPELTNKHVGDTAKVRFRLNDTTPQVRTSRLRAWPRRYNHDPGVRRAVAKIGCPHT